MFTSDDYKRVCCITNHGILGTIVGLSRDEKQYRVSWDGDGGWIQLRYPHEVIITDWGLDYDFVERIKERLGCQ